MRKPHSPLDAVKTGSVLGFGLLALVCSGEPSADTPPTAAGTVDRFTATTVSMSPADVELRIDVREWSDDASRSAVVAALGGETDIASALNELPTLGYVWRSDSGVGYSVKYAHRVDTEPGERLTFVTNKRLGAYDFEPWTVDGTAEPPKLDYSVIELYLPDNGSGDGTLSLGADVKLDEENGIVSLETAGDVPRLLGNAKEEPKPYWAKEG